MPDKIEIIRTLIALARAAHALADNTFEDDGGIHLDQPDLDDLSKHLDKLDELPDPPGEAATGPRCAEYWLFDDPDEPTGEAEPPRPVEAQGFINWVLFGMVTVIAVLVILLIHKFFVS